MRIFLQLAIATALVVVASSAGAARATQVAADMPSVQTIVVVPERRLTADAASLAGVYGLPSGQLLRVSYQGRRLFAELGQRKGELVPVGGGSFAMRDSGLRLRFEAVPFATDVVITGR